jgi:hypothetical protein
MARPCASTVARSRARSDVARLLVILLVAATMLDKTDDA